MSAPRFDLTGPLPAGRAAIEASAGTGKTYTLAALAARYVAEEGVDVDELLIVTFTRAAAAELRDRVRSRFTTTAHVLRAGPDDGGPADDVVAHLAERDREVRAERLEAAVTDFDAATITTIHGFAQQVLVSLGSAAPGDLDARLVDDSLELVAQVCADELAAAAITDPERTDELPTIRTLIKHVRTVLGNPGIAVVPDPAEAIGNGGRCHELVDRAVDEIHRRRRDAGTLAFDDLLTQLRDALDRSPAAAAALRSRYRVALIHEFQDTDPVQWGIFSTIFGTEEPRALGLVGDPKQAIYAFRGANVHTYLEATSGPGTDRATLATNWRSDQALLDALEPLLGGATFGDDRIGFVETGAAPEHATRRLSDADGAPLPAFELRAALGPELPRAKTGKQAITVPGAWRAVRHDLAHHVQQTLETVHLPGIDGAPGRPVRPGDVAVLVRTHEEAAQVQMALRGQGIPAVAHRGMSVVQSEAAIQWRWLLAALSRPSDERRARTAALSWFFGWSAERLDAAKDDQLAEVQERLYVWAELLETHGVVDFWAHVRAESGVTAVLAGPDGDRNLTDLTHLAELLQVRAPGHHPGPVGLIATLVLLDEARQIDPEEDLAARRIETDADAVQIMTIHAAKGLEFPVVLAPTLWRAGQASDCVFQDEERGGRVLDVTNGAAWPDKAAGARRKEQANVEADGEDLRLLYVALTRAQHRTTVWWSRAGGSDGTALGRLLFGRDASGRLDPDALTGEAVPMPDDALALALLAPVFVAAGDAVALAPVRPLNERRAKWEPPVATGAADPAELAVAVLGRELTRPHRRWSFSSISDRAQAPTADPADDSLGDAGAADEPVDEVDGEPVDAAGEPGPGSLEPTDLPLGALVGSAYFGSVVHELLEQVDFAAPDLDAELAGRIDALRRWYPIDALGDELHAGLRAAIETPLGPRFGGRRLRDLGRADRLDELTFELHLGTGGAPVTGRDVGALLTRHLGVDDPLRPWADRVASGLFDVDLSGHLTGSIDAIFRVADDEHPPRYVVVDYKTNVLSAPGSLPQSANYHPDLLPEAMAHHHYPLQALLYSVAVHRYLRWRQPGYDPAVHLGGVAYLFLRGMAGPDTPTVGGVPHGVFDWSVPPALVADLSDLLDGSLVHSLTALRTPLLDDVTTSLAPFVGAGVFDAAAVHVAATICRATGETDPDVVLAAALAARAPTQGHVCVVPALVAGTIVVDTADGASISALPWPDPDEWGERLAASAAVQGPDGRPWPLVWDGTRLYLQRYWWFERTVADDLLRRAEAPGAIGASQTDVAAALDRWFGAVDAAARESDATHGQRRAAEVALTGGLAVVVGGPGTGKTRTIARLLGAADDLTATRARPLDVVLAAPTGKAAARMTESVHHEITAADATGPLADQLRATEAVTLHRLLGWLGGTEYRHDARNPLPHDLVVVDETSMASLPLMARLLAAVRPDASLVLVGDPHQLASVEAGAVLGEIVGPVAAPPEPRPGPVRARIVVLERAHRFAADSEIAALARAIRAGDADGALAQLRAGGPEIAWVDDGDAAGIATLTRAVGAHAAEVLAEAGAGRAESGLARATELKVLCATRHGPLGSYRWNERVESLLAHEVPDAALYRRFYIGRPLIVTRNDYPHRLMNGDVGLVVARDDRGVAAFPDGAGVRELATSQLDEVETWWAMTIHKSQGSEFPRVIVTLPPDPSPILTRELLYTGVTRAREHVTVVASEAALRAAIARPVSRASGLVPRLHPVAPAAPRAAAPAAPATTERAAGVMTLPGLG